jgi:tetratricopeptide (TPR) repeat protein
MRSIRFIALTLVAAMALVSCRSNPEAAKKRYVESGDKYFNKGRYKEASIQYRNAVRIDGKYGLAYYKLAVTALKQVPPDFGQAVRSLRRAQELLNPDQPEHWDAVVKLSEIYLSPVVTDRDQALMDEVKKNCDDLLKRDPNSFDGHRLTADWRFVSSAKELAAKKAEEGEKELDAAIEEYRKADSIKPGDLGVTMQLARALTMKRDFPGAERYFHQTIDQKKDFLQAYRELYTVLWLENKRADAEQLLKAGYQNNPKEPVFLMWLAEQYRLEQRREDMLKVLAQLKSKVGEFPGAYLEVGDFYLRAGDPESAVGEYRDGMGKDAKNKSTYQKRIVEARMRQGKRLEAADVNAEVLKENPNDNDALGVKATLLLDKGDVTHALADLQQVVTHAPDNFVARFNLGRAYVLHNEVEQARQQFQKAIELHPDYIPARLALAQLQMAPPRPDFDAVIRSAEEILKLDQNNASAKLIWSAALMGQKKFDESRQMLETMLKANPSSADVLFQIGVLNLAENKFKDANDAFRRCYQLNPANARGLMGVVETDMAQNKVDQAIQELRVESAKTPARMDFRLAIGNVCVRAGRWDMAIAEFQTVLASTAKGSRTQGQMYLRIGETQRRKGDLNAAIVSLQAARQTLPEDQGVLSTLALTLDGAGRWPEAKQVYQAITKIYPNDPIVLNNLAFGMAEHGDDLDQALSMAQRARQLLTNPVPEFSDTLGWIYLKKNLPDNALEIFRDLVAKQPNQTTFRYHLGMAFAQKGDKAHALQELKRALEGRPSDEEGKKIKDLIARLG